MDHVARLLAATCHGDVHVLHDRRVLGAREPADHLAVAASGVWVIGTRRTTGKVTIHEARFGRDRLMVDGQDCSKRIDALDKQVAAARVVLQTIAPDVPVHGALCLVDAELPLFGGLSFCGYPVLCATALARRLNEAGPLDAAQTENLVQRLDGRFPPA
jgi:hypothetical protein